MKINQKEILLLLSVCLLWWSGSLYTPTSALEWLALQSALSWVLVMLCNKLMRGKLCASFIIIETACVSINSLYVYLPVNLSDIIYSIRPFFVHFAFIMQIIIIAISIGGRAIGITDRVGPRDTDRNSDRDDNNPFCISGSEAVAQ